MKLCFRIFVLFSRTARTSPRRMYCQNTKISVPSLKRHAISGPTTIETPRTKAGAASSASFRCPRGLANASRTARLRAASGTHSACSGGQIGEFRSSGCTVQCLVKGMNCWSANIKKLNAIARPLYGNWSLSRAKGL